MKKIAFAILFAALSSAVSAQGLASPSPASPVPLLQNMVGTLAGQLAITQAQLQDAQFRAQQLEVELKKVRPEPTPPADQQPAK